MLTASCSLADWLTAVHLELLGHAPACVLAVMVPAVHHLEAAAGRRAACHCVVGMCDAGSTCVTWVAGALLCVQTMPLARIASAAHLVLVLYD